jgi:O-antigen/teichoic acid export membrane protein
MPKRPRFQRSGFKRPTFKKPTFISAGFGKPVRKPEYNLTQQVAGNALAQVVGRILAVLLGLITVGIITRHIGTHGYGQYATAFGFLMLVGILIDFGLYLVIVRVISTHERNPDEIVANSIGLRLALFALSFLLILALLPFLPYEHVTKTAILVGSLSILGITLNQAIGGVFQAHLRIDLFVLGDVLGRAVTLFAAWYALAHGMGIVAVAWAVVIGYVANLALTLYFLPRFQPLRISFDLGVWRWILTEGLPLGALIILSALYLRLDVFLLSLFRSVSEVGTYGVATKMAEVVSGFGAIIVGATLPVLARRVGEQAHELARSISAEIYDLMIAIGAGLVVGALFEASPIIKLVAGPGFEDSVLPFQILVLAVALGFVTVLYGQLMVVWSAQRKLILPMIVGVTASLVLNLIFIPRYGALGAAWVMVASEAIILFSYRRVVGKVTGFRPPEGRISRLFVALLAMTATLWFTRSLPVLLVVILGTAVYGVMLVVLGVVSRDRLRSLVKLA